MICLKTRKQENGMFPPPAAGGHTVFLTAINSMGCRRLFVHSADDAQFLSARFVQNTERKIFIEKYVFLSTFCQPQDVIM